MGVIKTKSEKSAHRPNLGLVAVVSVGDDDLSKMIVNPDSSIDLMKAEKSLMNEKEDNTGKYGTATFRQFSIVNKTRS